MTKATLLQPKFLKLGQEAKQNIITSFNNNSFNDTDKQIIEEYLLFADLFKNQLQNSSITIQQIKKLFEVFSKKIQAVQ